MLSASRGSSWFIGDFRQAGDGIGPAVVEAFALVAGAAFGAFLKTHSVGELEDSVIGEVVHGEGVHGLGVVAFHHFGEVGIGGGAGLDVLEMMLKSPEDVRREDLGLQIGEKELGKGLLPLVTMWLQALFGVVDMDVVMGQFMYKSHQHLVGIEVLIQGDGAEFFVVSGSAKIT